MEIMDVFVQMEHFGMVNFVKLMDVMEDKYGMDHLVNVNMDITLMEVFVYFVLMVNNGMKVQKAVNV